MASTNQLGTNPRHSWQIFRFDPSTGAGSQVTSLERGVERARYGAESLSVSDDGRWLAFISCSDPLGLNHDGSPELFVMTAEGGELTQLTSDPALDAGTVYGVMISGSGNRLLFSADTDPLGTNAGRSPQLFVVSRDGSGLRQLTTTSAAFGSISDDGERIAFTSLGDLTGENPDGRVQVFGIHADGTGLRQITHLTVHASSAVLSGDGTSVAFSVFIQTWRIQRIQWDGSGFVDLANGEGQPSITDDGRTIVYQGAYPNDQIWKIGADGTQDTQLTSGAVRYNGSPVISGDGGRIAFRSVGGPYPGGNNPDGGDELIAMNSTGGDLRQLTLILAGGFAHSPEVTADGTRVFFLSPPSTGEYPEIFRIQADGTELAQVTSLTGRSPWQFSVSSDGNVVVFSTYPESGSGYNEDIFKINADGTGLTQLSPFGGGGTSLYPVISYDGQWVIFQSTLSVGNPDGSFEIFRVRTDATGLFPITADDDPNYNDKKPRLAETNPLWIAYQSASDKDGQNPDGSLEIFRTRITGAPVQRLTADPIYESIDPDISGNGNRVVYVSQADPLGANPDHNQEIFLYDVPTATRRQLTFTSSGGCYEPRFSRDGAWVSFLSTAPLLEPQREVHSEPYRLSIATGVLERLGGTECCGVQTYDPVSLDRTGTRAVFTGSGDWDGQNADRATDIYLVDQSARPTIRVGRDAPTLVSWDSEPKPLRYDVLRGDSASLGSGPGTVNLGAVFCIEDDSPDTHTAGLEDAVQPPAGHAFFYLYRGTQGLYDGPGSWGQGAAGAERIAGAGTCSP